MADFDTLADQYDFWVEKVAGAGRYDKIFTFLPEYTKSALDAGCGSGSLSLQLAEHFQYVIGVDISYRMIELAKKGQAEKQKENIDFIVADLEHLPFRGEGIFDFVVSVFTLHHTQLTITVPALRQLVKPGGRMVLCNCLAFVWQGSAFWARYVLTVLKQVPLKARTYGLRTMWRLVMFEMHPTWMRMRKRSAETWKPREFQGIYSRFLPGCKFEEGPGITVFWEAPRDT